MGPVTRDDSSIPAQTSACYTNAPVIRFIPKRAPIAGALVSL